METLLQGLPHVCVYLFDILVTECGGGAQTVGGGWNEAEQVCLPHARSGEFDEPGDHMPEVKYLGHKISQDIKVHACSGRSTRVQRVAALRSFLGLLGYCG